MSDRPGAPCPDCGRRSERLISGGAGFLFRGEGFYITDHRSEDYRRKAREEAGGAGDGKANDAPDKGDGASSGAPEPPDRRRRDEAPGGSGGRARPGDAAPAGSPSASGDAAPGGEGA